MKKIKFIVKLFLRDLFFQFRSGAGRALIPSDRDLLKRLKTDGLFTVKALFSSAEIKSFSEELERLLADKKTNLWVDKEDADHRIYGADQLSTTIKSYHTHPWINRILTVYQKSQDKTGFVMAAKMNYRTNNKGSGDGWHRDSPELMQTKSILYLTDVTPANGPFQYILGSHRFFYILRDWLRYGIDPRNSRFTNEQIEKLIEKEPKRLVEVTGNAGDILFADTRGIHRGKPIEKELRMAMTNYYWFNAPVPDHITPYLQKELEAPRSMEI